jgi:hypothetical protein
VRRRYQSFRIGENTRLGRRRCYSRRGGLSVEKFRCFSARAGFGPRAEGQAVDCGPLRYNPVVEQVAEISNRSTDQYLNHATATVPVSDPTPGLKDLGYRGKKGALLNGAARNEADAIKGALLEGFDKLPDCSYTDFGVSMLRNQSNGYYLTSLVLAGP